MERPNLYTLGMYYLVTLLLSAALSGCAGDPPSSHQSDPGGPKIVDMKTEPGTIELDRDLQPTLGGNPKVVVDVQDPHSSVTDVLLRFDNVPITIPMEHIGGSHWEARLDSNQLEMMAVSGQTVRYGAEVIAKSSDGKITTSPSPVEVAVKAPGEAQPAKI